MTAKHRAYHRSLSFASTCIQTLVLTQCLTIMVLYTFAPNELREISTYLALVIESFLLGLWLHYLSRG